MKSNKFGTINILLSSISALFLFYGCGGDTGEIKFPFHTIAQRNDSNYLLELKVRYLSKFRRSDSNFEYYEHYSDKFPRKYSGYYKINRDTVSLYFWGNRPATIGEKLVFTTKGLMWKERNIFFDYCKAFVGSPFQGTDHLSVYFSDNVNMAKLYGKWLESITAGQKYFINFTKDYRIYEDEKFVPYDTSRIEITYNSPLNIRENFNAPFIKISRGARKDTLRNEGDIYWQVLRLNDSVLNMVTYSGGNAFYKKLIRVR